MKRPALLAALLAIVATGPGCSGPPPTEGFTRTLLDDARRTLDVTSSGAKTATWSHLELEMLDHGITLARLRDVAVTLPKEPGRMATFDASVEAMGWCTISDEDGGLGQILALYLEKEGHALMLPWTLGAFVIEKGSGTQRLHFERVLDATLWNQVEEAEIVLQPAHWKPCGAATPAGNGRGGSQ